MSLATIGIVAAATLQGQPAPIQHGHLRSETAAAGLEKTISRLLSPGGPPSWIGWSEPMVEHRYQCCFETSRDWDRSPCGRCFLDDDHRNTANIDSNSDDCGGLDVSRTLLVFVRFEERQPSRVRTFSQDCAVDAGDQSVAWLSGVAPAESVAFLEKIAGSPGFERGSAERTRSAAVAAIAMHDDPSADAALERLVAPGKPDAVRRQATFWLGNARGRRGYEILRQLARSDSSDELRKHVTFALSQSREPEAIDTLIGMAKNDRAPEVRSQALFWLAQKAGKKGAAAIQDAIRDDPETEVKKRAVFALTQLPKDEGVPELIRVARTNRNPAVRKQAFFWLGQSKDPRALAFFEEVLTK
jgi:hypothetical protein